jgi:hypothetical protein
VTQNLKILGRPNRQIELRKGKWLNPSPYYYAAEFFCGPAGVFAGVGTNSFPLNFVPFTCRRASARIFAMTFPDDWRLAAN